MSSQEVLEVLEVGALLSFVLTDVVCGVQMLVSKAVRDKTYTSQTCLLHISKHLPWKSY